MREGPYLVTWQRVLHGLSPSSEGLFPPDDGRTCSNCTDNLSVEVGAAKAHNVYGRVSLNTFFHYKYDLTGCFMEIQYGYHGI